eukprot:11168043-Lingulodinium_polyedra.AAC.1
MQCCPGLESACALEALTLLAPLVAMLVRPATVPYLLSSACLLLCPCRTSCLGPAGARLPPPPLALTSTLTD